MAPMPAVLALDGVVKDYPARRSPREILASPFRRKLRRAVDCVSLEVQAGEIVALLGPNGSGKTTCVKLLAGLVRPTAGRAFVCGIDTAARPEEAQAQVGYVVSDERSFEWRLDARENLRFFGALHGLAGRVLDRRIEELAERLRISDQLRLPFRTLSSGQKARVAIARGLLHRPKALLLDEVTRTLDPGAAERLRRFVREELVDRDGLGVLLTTHDLHEARALSDSVALLVNGTLRATGSFDELEAPMHDAFFEEAA